MKKRMVAVYTGNRAEYGLLLPILNAISNHPKLEYSLIVSGAHLEEKYGRTINEIKADGFKISHQIKLDIRNNNLKNTPEAIGLGINSISQVLKKMKPDFCLVYGDRFETFSAAIASSQSGIPTAHVEGGDITEGGALDDSVRHAITKLSNLHFTTNKSATKRILRLGEERWRVFTAGYPTLDLIKANDYVSNEDMIKEFDINISKPLLLLSMHSVTLESDDVKKQVIPLLKSLERISKNIRIIATYPNNDAGGRAIIEEFRNFEKQNLNFTLVPSLGRKRFHGMLALNKIMDITMIGNSSAGIKETPVFKCPSINIGTRQQGRLRSTNIIDAGYTQKEILNAIDKSFDEKFRKLCKYCKNPYGKGNAGEVITSVLSKIAIDRKLIIKRMTY